MFTRILVVETGIGTVDNVDNTDVACILCSSISYTNRVLCSNCISTFIFMTLYGFDSCKRLMKYVYTVCCSGARFSKLLKKILGK